MICCRTVKNKDLKIGYWFIRKSLLKFEGIVGTEQCALKTDHRELREMVK
jgi:hypothetical protein